MSINYKLGVVVVLALLASGSVFAKTYGVWLKKGVNDPYVNSAGLKCATGTVDSDTGIFKMTIEAGCFLPGVPASTMPIEGTSAEVNTAMIQSKDEQPVSSADGITFDENAVLKLNWTSKAPEIGIRGFKFDNGTNPVVTGTYHLFTRKTDGNPVPEPEALWLALIGLAGLALTRRKRG